MEDENANAKLWDKIVIEVKGYSGAGTLSSDWRPVTSELAGKIRVQHKDTAITGMYAAQAKLTESVNESVNVDGGDNFRIRQAIGTSEEPEFVLNHTLREPTESERTDFQRKSKRTQYQNGSRKVKSRTTVNLKEYISLYDSLFVSLEGANLQGDEAKASLDPILKKQVIETLMEVVQSSLSD